MIHTLSNNTVTKDPTLKDGQVHLWQTSLLDTASQLDLLYHQLSSDELQRAERFIFPEHRRRFVITRAGLRILLGQYLNCDPAVIRFEYGPHGKPQLTASQQLTHPLYFNLAHSADWALYAISQIGELGIDLEQIRASFSCLEVAKQYFSAQEYAALAPLSSPQLEDSFFRYWTRKEALMKATGEGLNLAPNQFEVFLDTPHPALNQTEISPTAWYLYNLNAPSGFMAALAVNAPVDQFYYEIFSPVTCAKNTP